MLAAGIACVREFFRGAHAVSTQDLIAAAPSTRGIDKARAAAAPAPVAAASSAPTPV